LAEGEEAAEECGWLPDGRLLTFHRRDGTINLWPAAALGA
jgi:hypothetical protein